MQSPPPCPSTVTVRRNPPRRARPTPSSQIPRSPLPSTSSVLKTIPSFPIDDILSIDVPQKPESEEHTTSEQPPSNIQQPISESLKVFLRIRPLLVSKIGAQSSKARAKNAWPQNPSSKNTPKKPRKKGEVCISVNDCHSVTLCPPAAAQDGKRSKTETYDGFSHVFSSDVSQEEVFKVMVNPLVEEFLNGKSGMLAALGPSGSGKTHTVFGSARVPGMVPLTLRRIFSQAEGSRIFHLSMFEIYSEGGKGEKIIDLSPDGEESCSQQSAIKGLQEVVISDLGQAEQVIAKGMLKRATAMTNSNSQSSRSQCIINIRCAPHKIDKELNPHLRSAVFTIVDLAGAEREKRTGNQGARLQESNFINNTSMVFGSCLRSLLEHQKNPKKPLQRHFQNSLLTRYLRDYLEGKKRMAMLLTVKSGEEDYLDASFLLRQASPYMKIKFDNAEESFKAPCSKRPSQNSTRIEQPKRMKISSSELLTKRGKGAGQCNQPLKEESHSETVKEAELVEPGTELEGKTKVKNLREESTALANDRENKVMVGLSKAIWNVLKEYKKKLEVAETQIECLRENLSDERRQRSDLEIKLGELKEKNFHKKEVNVIRDDQSSPIRSAEQEGCLSTVTNEVAEFHIETELKESNSFILHEQEEASPVKDDQSSASRSIEQEGCKHIAIDEMAVIQIESPRKSLSDEMDQCSEIKSDFGELETCSSHQREVFLSGNYQSTASGSIEQEICWPTVADEIAKTPIKSLGESLSNERAESTEIETDPQRKLIDEGEAFVGDGKSSASTSTMQEGCRPTFIDECDGVESGGLARDSDCAEDTRKADIQIDTNKSDVVTSNSVSISPMSPGTTDNSCYTAEDHHSNSEEEKCNGVESAGLAGDADCAEDTRKADIQIDTNKPDVVPSNSVSNPSPMSPGTTGNSCYTAEDHHSNSEEDKKKSDTPVLPKEAAKLPTRYESSCSPKGEQLDSCSKLLPADKPKRRLQPSSCNLLRTISNLEFEDDTDKPKVSREKRTNSVKPTNTQGSRKLFDLLKTKRPSSRV